MSADGMLDLKNDLRDACWEHMKLAGFTLHK